MNGGQMTTAPLSIALEAKGLGDKRPISTPKKKKNAKSKKKQVKG